MPEDFVAGPAYCVVLFLLSFACHPISYSALASALVVTGKI